MDCVICGHNVDYFTVGIDIMSTKRITAYTDDELSRIDRLVSGSKNINIDTVKVICPYCEQDVSRYVDPDVMNALMEKLAAHLVIKEG